MARTRRMAAADNADTGSSLQAVTERLRQLEAPQLDATTGRKASVLVPLFCSGGGGSDEGGVQGAGEVRVLLTTRSAHLKSHQGEVCLPGGKRDPEDVDDTATALREAQEELGLSPSDVQVLAHLPPFLSKHFLSVTPVIALVPHTRDGHAPNPNPDEVAEVFDVPLSTFLGTAGHSSRDITWQDHSYRIHSFEYEGRNIWGLTAAILIKVASCAYTRAPAFQEHARRGVEYTRFWHDGQKLRVHTLAGKPLHTSAVSDEEEEQEAV